MTHTHEAAVLERTVDENGSIDLGEQYADRLAGLTPLRDGAPAGPTQYVEVPDDGTIHPYGPAAEGREVQVVIPEPDSVDAGAREELVSSSLLTGAREDSDA